MLVNLLHIDALPSQARELHLMSNILVIIRWIAEYHFFVLFATSLILDEMLRHQAHRQNPLWSRKIGLARMFRFERDRNFEWWKAILTESVEIRTLKPSWLVSYARAFLLLWLIDLPIFVVGVILSNVK